MACPGHRAEDAVVKSLNSGNILETDSLGFSSRVQPPTYKGRHLSWFLRTSLCPYAFNHEQTNKCEREHVVGWMRGLNA